MRDYVEDVVMIVGLAVGGVGAYLEFGLGWALISTGSVAFVCGFAAAALNRDRE